MVTLVVEKEKTIAEDIKGGLEEAIEYTKSKKKSKTIEFEEPEINMNEGTIEDRYDN